MLPPLQAKEHIDIISSVASAHERKILRPIDMKCIATFLRAVLDSDSLALLDSPSSVELELACAILQLSAQPECVNVVLKHAVIAVQHENRKLRDFLLEILVGMTENEMCHGFSPGAMIYLWASLADHLDMKLVAKLFMPVEDKLSHLFSTYDDQGKWIVYQHIVKDPELFIGRCLRTMEKMMRQHNTEVAAGCLLSSILTYDCSEFTSLAKILANIEHDNEYTTLWNSGQLDLIACTFLEQTQNQCVDEITSQPFYSKALSVIGKRLTFLLEQKVCK